MRERGSRDGQTKCTSIGVFLPEKLTSNATRSVWRNCLSTFSTKVYSKVCWELDCINFISYFRYQRYISDEDLVTAECRLRGTSTYRRILMAFRAITYTFNFVFVFQTSFDFIRTCALDWTVCARSLCDGSNRVFSP